MIEEMIKEIKDTEHLRALRNLITKLLDEPSNTGAYGVGQCKECNYVCSFNGNRIQCGKCGLTQDINNFIFWDKQEELKIIDLLLKAEA